MVLNRFVIGAISMVSLVGYSCDTSNSARLSTDLIDADFVATGQSSGETQVSATLVSSRGFFDKDVKLTGGDKLIATSIDPVTSEGEERKLKRKGYPGGVRYLRDFLGNQKDTLIQISFNRKRKDNVSALDSFVSLPAHFGLHWVSSTITREPASLDFSRSSDETRFVVWDPSGSPDFEAGDVLDFSVTGTCVEAYSGIIDWEDGEEALDLTNVLRDQAPPNNGQTCPVVVSIRLTREGVVDPAFMSGSFVGEQLRELTILAEP